MTGPDPSPMLEAVASSSASMWATIGLLVWIVGIIVLRALVLVDPRPVDRVILALVVVMVCVVVLRMPEVQDRLPFSLSDIRTLTHTLVLISAALLAATGWYWRSGRLPVPLTVLIAAALVGGVVLWLIARPARDAGVAVEELGGWRPVVYMTLYSGATPLAEIPAAVTAVSMLRAHKNSAAGLLFGSLVLLAIAASWVDHGTRMLTAWFAGFGVENFLTEWRVQPGSSNLLLLPVVAVLVLIAVPSVISSVRIRLGRDRESRSVQRLSGLWSDLAAVAPDLCLEPPQGVVSSAEQCHRMRVEIEDIIAEVSQYASVDHDGWSDDAEERSELLNEALRRREHGGPRASRPAPTWLTDDQSVDALATAWTARKEPLWP